MLARRSLGAGDKPRLWLRRVALPGEPGFEPCSGALRLVGSGGSEALSPRAHAWGGGPSQPCWGPGP